MRTARSSATPFSGLVLPASVARERVSQMLAAQGGYLGARRNRRQTSEWHALGGDADSDLLGDLPTLRDRSRDLQRNDALAAAILNTKITSVIGRGMTLLAEPDSDILGLSDLEYDRLRDQSENEFELWSGRECDIERISTFGELLSIAYRGVKESGDVFALLPFRERAGSPYGTKVQLLEADRVSNPNHQSDTATLSGGIERDPDTGAMVAVHIANHHPQSRRLARGGLTWSRVDAFNSDGSPAVLHLMDKRRVGQSRGVPDLSGVIEPLRMRQKYSEAEVMSAVLGAMFTIFVKSEYGSEMGDILGQVAGDTSTSRPASKSIELGNGAAVSLMPGEDVTFADPKRPNSGYEPFMSQFSKEIAAACEMPIEVVQKRFETSYTAARGAVNEVWRYYLREREWMATDFAQPIYEAVFGEAVARGRINAPGYLRGDHLTRWAYTRATWIGPGRGQINETAETQGAEKRLELGITTHEEETAQITGTSWRRKQSRRAREERLKRETMGEPPAAPQSPPPSVASADPESANASIEAVNYAG